MEPDLDLWDAWRPEEIARRLAGVRAPWYVAAGWAIELFLGGGQRRKHEDLEIAAPSDRFDEVVEALPELETFVVVGQGKVEPLATARDKLPSTHQTWLRDPETKEWRLDVFREPSDGDTWICRRDESIRLPYSQVIERTGDGIPYGRPEIALLFKARHSHEEKNRLDFADTVPRLDAGRRAWLADALARVHPGHEWLDAL